MALTKSRQRDMNYPGAGPGRVVEFTPKAGVKFFHGSAVMVEAGLLVLGAATAGARPVGVFYGPDLDLTNVAQTAVPPARVFVGSVYFEDAAALQADVGKVGHFTDDDSWMAGKGTLAAGVLCEKVDVGVGRWLNFAHQAAA